MDFANYIKTALSMQDIADQYGLKQNKAGFIVCPFHYEKTASLRLYETDYHCFGCGAHGDIIGFVMQLFKIGFSQAINKLDYDFSLGLPLSKKPTYREKIEMAKAKKKWEEDRAIWEAEREIADQEYWTVFERWLYLAQNKSLYAPASPDDELNPLFVESLKELAYQEYLLDRVEMKRGEMRDERFDHTRVDKGGLHKHANTV